MCNLKYDKVGGNIDQHFSIFDDILYKKQLSENKIISWHKRLLINNKFILFS